MCVQRLWPRPPTVDWGTSVHPTNQQPAAETTAAAALHRWLDAVEDAVSDARQALTGGYERVTGQA